MTDKANGFSLLSYLDGGGLMNVYAKNDTEMGEVIEGRCLVLDRG